MDIGVYISELLARNGELSVPGLGFLVLQKVPGHYNESDGKFYPPSSVVKFDPQQIEDDTTLVQYIADQKNISVSSAKYFAEKYTASIREDALVREVHVGDVGSFLADQGQLIFIPSQKQVSNPAFFGLAPVNLPARISPPASPVVTPAAPTEPEKPSFSNFTAPQQPSPAEANRPAEPVSTPPPATPQPSISVRDRQALIDAFNANNKGGYVEQGVPIPPPRSQAPPAAQPATNYTPPPVTPQPTPTPSWSKQSPIQQSTRPDIYPPMDPSHPLAAAHAHHEEEEKKRPIALFILIGLIVVLGVGVVALKKFAPAKFEALTHIFSHKKATVETIDGKTGDTARIKEPVPVIPPKIDSAKQDSINKAQALAQAAAMDPVKMKKLKDSLRKDSIKQRKQRIAEARQRHIDSLAAVQKAKIQRENEIRDSIKAVKAAALAEKLAAAKNKKAAVVVTPPPVQTKTIVMPAPAQNTKVPPPGVQRTGIAVPESSGSLTFMPIDPGKTWFAVIGAGTTSPAIAESRIAGLKKIGIEAFAVKKGGTTIFVAMGAYAKNSEADAAATKFKQSGAADAYITQITK